MDGPHSEGPAVATPGGASSRLPSKGVAEPRPKMVFGDKGLRAAAGKPPGQNSHRPSVVQTQEVASARQRPKSKGQLRKERLFSSQNSLEQSREAPGHQKQTLGTSVQDRETQGLSPGPPEGPAHGV